MEFFKKADKSFYMTAAAGLLALVGAILFIVTNASVYPVQLGGMGIAFSLIAALLAGGAAYLGTVWGADDYKVTIMTFVSAILSMVCVGLLILSRADLAAALVTYDSGNVVGWAVFGQSIASIVLLVLSSITLIVNAFLAKPNKAE